jgi:hypothetical protein
LLVEPEIQRFQRPGGENWRLEACGQIEGIGTSPQLTVKDSVSKVSAWVISTNEELMIAKHAGSLPGLV